MPSGRNAWRPRIDHGATRIERRRITTLAPFPVHLYAIRLQQGGLKWTEQKKNVQPDIEVQHVLKRETLTPRGSHLIPRHRLRHTKVSSDTSRWSEYCHSCSLESSNHSVKLGQPTKRGEMRCKGEGEGLDQIPPMSHLPKRRLDRFHEDANENAFLRAQHDSPPHQGGGKKGKRPCSAADP